MVPADHNETGRGANFDGRGHPPLRRNQFVVDSPERGSLFVTRPGTFKSSPQNSMRNHSILMKALRR
jgi:hypothetical protein